MSQSANRQATRTTPELSGVLGQLRSQRSSLLPAERRVADVVLGSPQDIVHLPIAELANRAKVSEGTIVRFCQTVGCKGYQAFKIQLAFDLAQPAAVIHGDVQPGDSPAAVAQRVFASDQQALQDTLRWLDADALDRAVDALVEARRIELFGAGTSLPVAFDAYSHWLRIGLPVHLEFDAYLQSMQASLLGDGDAALAVSHSGHSRGPVSCLALAHKRGATTIALTGSHPSPLTAHAGIVLVTVSSEIAYREEAMASRIAQLSVIDTLYVATALRRPDEAIAGLRLTSEAVADERLPDGGRRSGRGPDRRSRGRGRPRARRDPR